MLVRNARTIHRVHNEQQRTQHWALRHRAENVNSAWFAAAKHDIERSAWQVRPKPVSTIPYSPNYRSDRSNSSSWSTVSKAAVRSRRHKADILPPSSANSRSLKPLLPFFSAVELSIRRLHLRHQSVAVEEGLDTNLNDLIQQFGDKW